MVVNNELEIKYKEVVVAQLEILFQNFVEKQRKPQRISVTTISLQKFESWNYWPLFRSVAP
jgi:hypothetical protein